MIAVETVITKDDAGDLDELLWRVLWQPLGLLREVRRQFNIGGEEIELIARKDGQLVGGLVAVWTPDADIELRHLAVDPGVQLKGVGRSLIAKLLHLAVSERCHRIHTIARNTSVCFFQKQGFCITSGKAPEHPVFLEHGITFELMEKVIEKAGSTDG